MEQITKLANALYPDAEPSDLVKGPVIFTVKLFRMIYGGLWVGGEVILDSNGLTFTPNSTNYKYHKNLSPVHIPIKSIQSLIPKPSIGMKIVEVKHSDGTFQFRCYGAQEFIAKYHESSK